MSTPIPHLLALHRTLNLTHRRYQKLKTYFENDWGSALKANSQQLAEAGIDPKGAERFFANRSSTTPEAETEALHKCNAQPLFIEDQNYPHTLLHIDPPPVLLFVKGSLNPIDFPALSVVGARKMTDYGREATKSIVAPIAENKITIVSGLAMGIDAQAHKEAIKTNCKTIAVLGNSIDTIYPGQNRFLAQRILETKGTIISEYLPQTEGKPEFFPIRNRIIAGLSQATIVIEGAQNSGSLITAHLANQQGRDVFAVPGEIFSKNSEGTNWLIASGSAHPALSGDQVLETLGIKNLAAKRQAQIALPENPIETEILSHFANGEKWHIDGIIRQLPFPPNTTASHLQIMEIKGLIKNIGSQIYIRGW